MRGFPPASALLLAAAWACVISTWPGWQTRGIHRDICFKPLALDHRPAVQMDEYECDACPPPILYLQLTQLLQAFLGVVIHFLPSPNPLIFRHLPYPSSDFQTF